jgi:cytochrome b involved in lipid metabolism
MPMVAKATPCDRDAGRDSTQDFDEIGHSNSAKELLEKYHIGLLEVRWWHCPLHAMEIT